MRVKIYLHGHLKDKIQKEYVEVEALTVYEALKALVFKYEKNLKAPLDIGRWRIRIKDYDTKESWYVPIYTKELHIYPLFRTAKSRWIEVAIGATLMAIATFLLPTGLFATALFTIGLGMVIDGTINILFPTPKLDTSLDASNNSKYLGAKGNTTAAGTRIPFGYGLFKVSGHFISYNVSSTVIKTV